MMQYPGQPIRETLLSKGGVVGAVAIRDYGESAKHRYRVAAFCPGEVQSTPGDTFKTWPEREDWCDYIDEALDFFDIYSATAKLDGWREYQPEL